MTALSIGIIGGADGPTQIFVTSSGGSRTIWLLAAVLIAAFFCRLVLFLFRYPLAGVMGAAPVLLRYDLPHAVYSAVLAVPLYYPGRALHRMAEERTDSRL